MSFLLIAFQALANHLHQADIQELSLIHIFGEMSAIDPESLRFCFEAMIQGTDLESLELGIEVCPLRYRCQVCGREFVVRDYDSHCPQCASLETTYISGDELELAYLEVEEYGPSPVGAKSTQ